jgi:hypothetical protein
MNDLMRVKVATAHANGDLDELRALALAAIDDLDMVINAYDGLADEVVYVRTRGNAT